jgi:hypothetical protein
MYVDGKYMYFMTANSPPVPISAILPQVAELCEPATSSTAVSSDRTTASRVHQCSIYHKEFLTGQALDGHKRIFYEILCVLICCIRFSIHDIMCYYILLLSKFENCQNIDKILPFF